MDQLITEDPTRIGPYRLIARLGAGGMGLVYLGRSEAGRTVAVKVVQAEHAQHPEFRRRFTREVEAARRVGGEWTAAVLDADTEAPVPWVATQYIPGPDLSTVVAQDFGPLPEHSVRVLANRLAAALQSVHAAGLIHRDLKPSNVLVTVDGPRVIDFGIARAMDGLGGDSLHTRTGMLIGSPGFMSPEQVRGLELTPASDVFCLGAVLVYAATGRLLFGATDTGLSAHLFRIAEEEPDLTGVPDSLLDLVRECLHKDPTRRPTPAEVAVRTATDRAEEWLPGSVLAQLGRHAAQLLDFAPETRTTTPDPRIPAQVPPHPAYTPTAPVGQGAAQPGFGPAVDVVPGAWGAPTTPAGQVGPSPRRWAGLAVAVLAQFMVLVGSTSTNMAMPTIQADFGMSVDDLRLLPFSYGIAFGALLLLGGHLTDLLGRKRAAIIGLAGFAVASVLVGMASSTPMFVAAYALQGAFAALLSSAALALVAGGFTDPKERGTAFGIYAVMAGGGLAIGVFAGGWLIQNLDWRWCFYAAVPLALIAVAPVARLVDDRSVRASARLDVPGLLLGTGALTALVLGFHRAEAVHGSQDSGGHGWVAPLTVVLLLVGVALLATFVWWQTWTSSPLVPPQVFQDRARAGSLLALALVGMGVPTVFLILSLYVQGILDGTPAGTGLALLPLAGAVLVAALVSGPLRARFAPRWLIVPGLAVAAVGVALLAGLGTDSSYTTGVLPGIVLVGLGLGVALGPLLATVTGANGPQGSGGTAGTVLAAQSFGGWLGAPLLGSVLATAIAGRLEGMRDVPQDLADAVRSGLLIDPHRVPESMAAAVAQTNEAVLGGYSTALWSLAGLLLLAGLLVGLLVTTPAPERGR